MNKRQSVPPPPPMTDQELEASLLEELSAYGDVYLEARRVGDNERAWFIHGLTLPIRNELRELRYRMLHAA